MLITDFAESPRWLGETIGFWIQTFILTVSAVAAVAIIWSSKSQEKRRATVDLIIEQKRDEKIQTARHLILRMHEDGEKNLARHLQDPNCEQYKAILAVLNAYEFVASGIRSGAFHEGTYKRLRYFNLRRDWDALCGFVQEFRRSKGSATLFQDFQWLNGRWAKDPLKADNEQHLI